MMTPAPSDLPPAASASGARVALVTGGAKRVGRATALELARAGLDIAITCLSSIEDARQTASDIESLGRRCHVIEVNLADAAAVEVIHQAILAHFGRLDVLVNNASVFEPSPLADLTQADFDRQMVINALMPVLLMQKFAPMLKAHHQMEDPATMGRVINFIDVHILSQHIKGFMAYNASKAALMEATMTAAVELAPAITVNAIAPGVVAWAESYTTQQQQSYMKRVPLGRPGTPQDAATAVKFLACDAHYCTGQIIKLDGGRSLS